MKMAMGIDKGMDVDIRDMNSEREATTDGGEGQNMVTEMGTENRQTPETETTLDGSVPVTARLWTWKRIDHHLKRNQSIGRSGMTFPPEKQLAASRGHIN